MNHGTSRTYHDTDTRRFYLSSTAFLLSNRRVPRNMDSVEILNSRDWPVRLPTGTPRSSSTTLRVPHIPQLPGDPSPTTPHGTTTLRDPQSLRYRTFLAETHLLQRPELNHGLSDVAVRADPIDTPEGSTVMYAYHHAAILVLPTDTPPVRVM